MPDPRFVVDLLDDLGQVLETPPQVGALAGGVLDHRRDAPGLGEHMVDRVGDAGQALAFADLLQVAAGMEVEQREPELFAALEFVEKGRAGLLESGGIRVAEVDQVAVVGKYLPRAEAVLAAGRAEGLDGLVGQRLGVPLALVLGEQCKGVGALSG